MKKNLTHGSTFSGIGGFDQGAEMSGIETIWSCEKDPDCRRYLKNLYPSAKQYEDITQLHDPEPADVISGGFPCQNISRAASRLRTGADGEKSGLWRELYRVVEEMAPRPLYIVAENSPDLLHLGFDTIIEAFAQIGYVCEWDCLSGYDFGLHQKRTRLYAVFYSISLRDGLPEEKVFSGWHKPKYPTWRDSEPKIYGVANVLPDRVPERRSKHRALGNAVQPIIAHYLFECIKAHYQRFALQGIGAAELLSSV